eukprot:scaffold1945_cov395-Prasinococcus_capsulatus_cf.AAC.7
MSVSWSRTCRGRLAYEESGSGCTGFPSRMSCLPAPGYRAVFASARKEYPIQRDQLSGIEAHPRVGSQRPHLVNIARLQCVSQLG